MLEVLENVSEVCVMYSELPPFHPLIYVLLHTFVDWPEKGKKPVINGEGCYYFRHYNAKS